ncbi:MAG: hypothetical protein ACLQSR_05625, partial [Limisphaerales bacterium]
ALFDLGGIIYQQGGQLFVTRIGHNQSFKFQVSSFKFQSAGFYYCGDTEARRKTSLFYPQISPITQIKALCTYLIETC